MNKIIATDDLAQMQALGLPIAFNDRSTGDANSSNNKAPKRKFECCLCECELTSGIARDCHINGRNHQKKISIYNQKKSDQGVGHGQQQEWGGRRQGDRGPTTKKKIPVRLHTIIRETAEPIIGLGQSSSMTEGGGRLTHSFGHLSITLFAL